jgi:hypothetical protein
LACRSCHRKYTKQYRNNPDPTFQANQTAKIEANFLRKKYGIEPEDYQYLLVLQDGRCAICRSLPEDNGHTDKLFLDHNHTSGATRQLLCQRCNTGIGMLKDNPALLRLAADYLDAWNGTS